MKILIVYIGIVLLFVIMDICKRIRLTFKQKENKECLKRRVVEKGLISSKEIYGYKNTSIFVVDEMHGIVYFENDKNRYEFPFLTICGYYDVGTRNAGLGKEVYIRLCLRDFNRDEVDLIIFNGDRFGEHFPQEYNQGYKDSCEIGRAICSQLNLVLDYAEHSDLFQKEGVYVKKDLYEKYIVSEKKSEKYIELLNSILNKAVANAVSDMRKYDKRKDGKQDLTMDKELAMIFCVLQEYDVFTSDINYLPCFQEKLQMFFKMINYTPTDISEIRLSRLKDENSRKGNERYIQYQSLLKPFEIRK